MDIKEKLLLIKKGFSKEQVDEIAKGEDGFLDTALYAKKEFLSLQMKEIRLGMEEGLDVEIYARPDFDWLQMAEIRQGLAHDDDVSKFAFPKLRYDVMKEIRLGLEEGINLASYSKFPAEVLKEIRAAHKSEVDIIPYVERNFDAEQLEQIRLALEHHVRIADYIKFEYRGISLMEIRIGLERHVNVSEYAFTEYEWRQMRELRLGLEHQVDINYFRNPLYNWKQMRELRLGLELGLNVGYYTSFMYTAKEMKKRREYMLSHMNDNFRGKQAPVIIDYDNFVVTISDDQFSASIKMKKRAELLTKEAIIRMLREQNIVFGIKEDIIAELVEGSHINQTVVVAEGKKPVDGSDGYYEFFFKTDINREPKILDDGSLDYQNIEWFEQVVKDQKLAYYHSATSGEEGCTVLGANIQPKPGIQLPVINGEGFRIDGDNKTYISNMTGLVEYNKGRLVVTNLMVLDEVNSSMGNVVFDGSISVRGNVQTGSYVSCTGDLYVSGAVEGAVIEVDGEIIIKQGINASRKGSVKSKKSISARFIESANVRAEGSITVNYILNSIVQSRSNIKVMGRKGSIIGGVTYATKEIEVNQVGNDAFVKTLLKVGLDDEMVREQVRIEKQIKEIDKNLESLNLLFNQLNETFTGRERESNDTYVKIESAMFNKNKEKKELLEAKAAISKVINQTLLSKVVISGMAYENSIVEVNGKRWASKGVKDVTIKTSADSTVKVEAKW